VVAHGRGLRSIVDDVRARAVRYGRQPDDIKFVLAVSPIVGGTEAEARAKESDLRESLSIEGGLVHMSGNLGVDLGEVDPDQPIGSFDFNRVTGIVKSMAEAEPDKTMTFGDLARRQMSGQWMTGTPEQLADRFERLAEHGADGFNLIYTTTPGTFVDFIDGVVPVLQDRGLMQTEYTPGTFRQKLFGTSQRKVSDT
jgi:alkanesulfonate monooxygenase SsuD/methylene tetrahydromethanopterin reductase-like flavin-dependent oxidoreductase (luciferase family)